MRGKIKRLEHGQVEIYRDQGRYFHIKRHYYITEHNGVRDFKPLLINYYRLNVIRAGACPVIFQGTYGETKKELKKYLKTKKKVRPKK